MGYVTTKDGVDIFYKDWGPKNAQPLVFHHGWPLSADDWDTQMLYFVDEGYRVIAHVKLPRFRGHPNVGIFGVHDGKEAGTICAGVPPADD